MHVYSTSTNITAAEIAIVPQCGSMQKDQWIEDRTKNYCL